jgi:iron(III) transport system permease protein
MSTATRFKLPSRPWSRVSDLTPPAWLNTQTIVYALLFLVVANVVLVPLAMVVATSINLGPIATSTGGATIANLVNAWTQSSTYTTLSNTIVFAIGSTVVAVSGGVFFALVIERTDMPFKTLAFAAIALTFALPGMLYGIAWALLLSPDIGLINLGLLRLIGAEHGLLTSWAGIGFRGAPLNGYSMPGMILVDGLRGVAPVFLITVGVFRSMDPSLEEAAAISGASPRVVVRRVTLRLMLPGILAATIYSFIGNVESFDIPAVLGLPGNIYLLSTKIYLLNQSDDQGLASALGLAFLLISVLLVWQYNRQTRLIESFSTVTGKGYRPRGLSVGRFRYVALGLVGLHLFLVVVAPVFVIVWASLLPYYQLPSWHLIHELNLSSYRWAATHPWATSALKNTLIVALVAGTTTMILASLISWFVVRSKARGRRVLDILAFFPHAVPSTVIGLALIYVFLTPPWRLIPIYATVWIIVLAFTTRGLAFGTRNMHGAVIQLHKELEEAAHVSGATWRRTFTRVVFPLLLPAFVSGWVFIALFAMRDATMPLLLGSTDTRTVAVLMWDSWVNANVNKASALGVFLVTAIGIVTFLGRWVEQRRARRITGR